MWMYWYKIEIQVELFQLLEHVFPGHRLSDIPVSPPKGTLVSP